MVVNAPKQLGPVRAAALVGVVLAGGEGRRRCEGGEGGEGAPARVSGALSCAGAFAPWGGAIGRADATADRSATFRAVLGFAER